MSVSQRREPLVALRDKAEEIVIALTVAKELKAFSSFNSGVGKSSLLSRIMPKEDIRIGVLNPMLGKGRQKTTATHAYAFRDGFLVDTPGIREFGFVGVDPLRVSRGFPDIREIEAGCKFNNCLHLTDPDCAVRDAFEAGALARERYRSFLRIVESLVRS